MITLYMMKVHLNNIIIYIPSCILVAISTFGYYSPIVSGFIATSGIPLAYEIISGSCYWVYANWRYSFKLSHIS